MYVHTYTGPEDEDRMMVPSVGTLVVFWHTQVLLSPTQVPCPLADAMAQTLLCLPGRFHRGTLTGYAGSIRIVAVFREHEGDWWTDEDRL